MKTSVIIGIYKITSPTGRVYIGQSWDIYRRWLCHKNDRRNGCRLIQRSLRKHGVDAHRFEIIHEISSDATQDHLNYWERFYVDAMRLSGASLLNLTEGGNNGKPTEAVRQRLRAPKSDAHRANIAKAVAKQWAEGTKKGRVLSDESREKIRTTMTGRKYSPERVAKASDWVRTSETKAKISKALQGRSSTVKLTPVQVLDIRRKYIPREYSLRRLASEYGVDHKTIRGVVNRTSWAHV